MIAQDYIDRPGLQPHPEGGYFKETYRAQNEGRAASTGIYFLLGANDVSHFHRIDADEMWHFYAGAPLTVHMIDPETRAHSHFTLGSNLKAGQLFQAVVPAGVWFGAHLASKAHKDDFALVGCTVAPAFEFEHFELAQRAALLDEFPEHEAIVTQLTLQNH